jgi:Rad3-related DNA helicase
MRVIVSTKTKQLQDQIYQKEIPFLKDKLGLDFRTTILKGRANYLCLRKWNEMIGAPSLLLRGWEADEILPLLPWVEETETGDISECYSFNEKENRILWARFASDANNCMGSRCPFFNDCFVMRKRREALSAHIVLVNHSLFFTDLKGNGSVLGKFTHIIFDEAHSLEDVGRKHLGHEISHLMFSTALQKIHKKEGAGHGLLRYLENMLHRVNHAQADNIRRTVESLQEAVAEAELQSVRFFRNIGSTLKKKRIDKIRYKSSFLETAGIEKEKGYSLAPLVARLKGLIGMLENLDCDEVALDSVVFDIMAGTNEIEELDTVLQRLLQADDEGYVFWVETPANPLNVKLIGVPLEIKEIMGKKFLKEVETAVFTSATLAVNGDLDFFCKKIGLTEYETDRADKVLIGSHFDFNRQLLFAVKKGEHRPGDAAFIDDVSDMVVRLSKILRKRMLVLFTARDMLRNVYNNIATELLSSKVPLLAQDISGTGIYLLEEMRRLPGSVLLGTDSFWEGVDLPGEHLELVLIVRLPFSVPTDPIVEARAEQCDRNGENAFSAFYLPDAVIKFRQGTGRLIRRKDDLGVVLVLDTRIIEKSYGKVFRRAIDSELMIYHKQQEMIDSITNWFKK